MPRAGREPETSDPGSIHVNTHCTTAQLCNYSTERKADTKNTPTMVALMKSSSFTKAFLLLLPRKTSKERAMSTLFLSGDNQLKRYFLLCVTCLPNVNNTKREDGQVTYATPFSRAFPPTSSMILINSDV